MHKQNRKLIAGAAVAALALSLGPALLGQSQGQNSGSSDASSSQATGVQNTSDPSAGSTSASSTSPSSSGPTSNSFATSSNPNTHLPAAYGSMSPDPQSGASSAPAAQLGAADSAHQPGLRVASQDESNRTAEKLAGKKVRGPDGKEIGTVKDFLVDPHSGKVRFAVVSTGGFMGLGTTLHTVPFSALQQPGGSSEGFTASVSRQQLEQAPTVQQEQFDENRVTLDQSTLQQAQQALGGSPSPTSGSSSNSIALLRATKLQGKDVKANGSTIASIKALVIAPGQNTAMALVNPDQQSAGGSDQNFLVPLNRLSFSGNNPSDITTTLSRSDFQSAAQSATSTTSTSGFASNDRSSSSSGAMIAGAGSAQNDASGPNGNPSASSQRLSQNAGSDATSGAALATNGNSEAAPSSTTSSNATGASSSAPPGLTPTGVSSADQNPSASSDLLRQAEAVRHALDADRSVAHEDVRVTPQNGKLTLQGTVSSDTTKSRIEQIAKQAAAGDVESDLKVENK